MKRAETKQQRVQRAAKELEKTLRMSGYYRCLAKGVEAAVVPFPDLSVPTTPYPSLGSGFSPLRGKKQLHPDAKQFPVGNSHKQGLELILPKEVQYMNGKKT